MLRTTERSLTGSIPYVAPAWFVDFCCANEVIPVIESMLGQNDAWVIIGMYGVGADTHNNFMNSDKYYRLIDWITEQGAWLEPVTILESINNFSDSC